MSTAELITPKTGVQIGSDEYHALPGVSNSKLSDLLDDPRIYWWKHLSGWYRPPQKDYYDFGTAVHSLALESHDARLVLIPEAVLTSDGKRAGNKWKQFCQDNAGAILLRQKEYDAVHRCADVIKADAVAGQLLALPNGLTECMFAAADVDLELALRCKTDRIILANNIVLDIKTTEKSTKPGSFASSVADYGYHRQEAFYRRVLSMLGHRVDKFIFIAVCTKEPHTVDCFTLSPEFLEAGTIAVENGLAELSERIRQDNWLPRSYGRVVEIGPPNWLKYSGDYEL